MKEDDHLLCYVIMIGGSYIEPEDKKLHWKGYAVMSPGFHMRNMYSNWFNNFLFFYKGIQI